MSTQPTPPDYLLIVRGTHWDKRLSPQEIQAAMARWNVWFEDLQHRAALKGANPLEEEGVMVTGAKGRTSVVDGPFAESKEAVAGYFLLHVDSFDAAVAIARAYPLLDYGMTVEVRPVADMCPGNRFVAQLKSAAVGAH